MISVAALAFITHWLVFLVAFVFGGSWAGVRR